MNRLSVDWDLCESNGSCAAVAPEAFEIDDDDMLQVLVGPELSDEMLISVEVAVRVCPKRALSVSSE